MISYFDTAYPTIYKLKAVFIVERLLSDSEHTAKLSSGKKQALSLLSYPAQVQVHGPPFTRIFQ
jgi:hypothetical protein